MSLSEGTTPTSRHNHKGYRGKAMEGIVEDNEEDGRITLTNVKDSQSQQPTEALRLVRRIRAKQYSLLKLRNILLQVRLYIP
jgi:hypothetical protein